MMRWIVWCVVVMAGFSGVCAAERPENELPMYGGRDTPNVEPNAKASASAARLGWEYYYRGDLDTAIKRFNQAWMFDHGSVDALWGFGLIMGRRAEKGDTEINLKESIRFLEQAQSAARGRAQITVDLAFSHVLLGAFYKEGKRGGAEEEFARAQQFFELAEKQDAKYPLLHGNWSVLEFYRGDYAEAWRRLEQAKGVGFKPDPAYVKDLEGKLKDR